MIDLMNHSSTGTAELSYDYFADRYSVAAGRNYAVGEQASAIRISPYCNAGFYSYGWLRRTAGSSAWMA